MVKLKNYEEKLNIKFSDGRSIIKYVSYILYVSAFARVNAQIPISEKYPEAKISEKPMYTFDVARPLKHFDALADGSDWFAVDEFGLLQTMIIRGKRFERRFNEIQPPTAKFSPNGDYLIWMGLDRSYDEQGFNTTKTTVFKSTKKSSVPDSVGTYTSDDNHLYFSKSGKHWAATMPAAKSTQTGLRDVVLIDGLVMGKDNPKPGQFTFGKDESLWAYRSTEGPDENLVTTYAVNKLYSHKTVRNAASLPSDPVIYYFSPDLRAHPFFLESRDYDFGLPHQALLLKTSYMPERSDTSHMYVIFNNIRQPNFRWINFIQIDTAGNHIAYFACDTNGERRRGRNERYGVLVEDGKIIAGPYQETDRVFLSPSGKNIAWTAKLNNEAALYLNGKKIGPVGEYTDVTWSADEKKLAYETVDEHKKLIVVTDGKRSASYDRIGRIGWTDKNKAVEFCAIKYDKLVHIKQSF